MPCHIPTKDSNHIHLWEIYLCDLICESYLYIFAIICIYIYAYIYDILYMCMHSMSESTIGMDSLWF